MDVLVAVVVPVVVVAAAAVEVMGKFVKGSNT